MSEISPTLVKTLREKTGAGMMDCKKALVEVGGHLEDAVDWLRKKGLAAAAKKAGRVAAEGLIAIYGKGNCAAVVELNAETDFVARNPKFQDFALKLAYEVYGYTHTVESLLSQKTADGTIETDLNALIATVGENMQIRRLKRLSVQQGIVATYMHGAIAPDLGKIGVLVALESSAPSDFLMDLGKKIAMHVAATNPHALSILEVDPVALERERAVLIEQARVSNRPEDVIQKMVEGRVRKYYEEVVLLEQPFVMDGKTKISEVVAQASKEIGKPITLTGFARFALGEGIEKVVTDFAAEVQAQAGL